VPRCDNCGGLVKPDIVFFGEGLPDRFFDKLGVDFPKCDLLLVIGTSLQVQPFASLIARVKEHVPRVLINREAVGTFNPKLSALMSGPGNFNIIIRTHFVQDFFRFNLPNNYRDIALLGDCQEATREFVKLLGWEEDLEALLNA
jgi:NAD-dependent deacetylase sirtuin 2